MTNPTILPGRAFQQIDPVSVLLYHWRATELSLSARSGQAGAFTRASPGGVVLGKGSRWWKDTDILVGPHPDGLQRWQLTGGVPGLLLEAARTNRALRSRDMSNVAWTKTSITATLTELGMDGKANAASLLLATGANGTCFQAITNASAARTFSAYVKRITGSGTIEITLDNGSTFTDITATVDAASGFVRVSATQTLANPTVGFRIVTSADAIAVDFTQEETGSFASSAIPTLGSAVTRALEALSFPFSPLIQGLTIYDSFVERGYAGASALRYYSLGSDSAAGPYLRMDTQAGGLRAAWHNGTSSVTSETGAVPANGDTVESLLTLTNAGIVRAHHSINSGAQSNGTASAALAPPTPPVFNAATLFMHGASANFVERRALKIAPGVRTMDYMRESF